MGLTLHFISAGQLRDGNCDDSIIILSFGKIVDKQHDTEVLHYGKFVLQAAGVFQPD